MAGHVVAFGAVGEVASGNAVVDVPNAAQLGDLLVACIAYRSNAAFSVPAGWTKVEEENSGNTTDSATTSIASVMVAVKLVTAPDLPLPADYTFTRAAGSVATWSMVAVRGVDQSTQIDVSSSATPGAAALLIGPTASISTTVAETMLLFVGATARVFADCFNHTSTDPIAAAWDELLATDTPTGPGVGLDIAEARKASTGATGSIQCTVDPNSSRNPLAVIAIRSLLSVAVSPAVVAAVGTVVNPSVIRGPITVEPNVSAKGAVVNPAIVRGSVVVSPAPVSAGGAVVDPLVGTSSVSITPAQASASGIVVNPEVKGELIIGPAAVEARGEASIEAVEVSFGPLFVPEGGVSNVWTPEDPR